MKKYIILSKLDNVGVAIVDLKAGEVLSLNGESLELKTAVPTGHKFALREIDTGENVVKYGYPIGHTTESVCAGEHLHTHNVKTNLQDNLEYRYTPHLAKVEVEQSSRTINGYLRYNGEMGIRNEIWIVPTVGCVNGLAQRVVERAKQELDIAHLDDIRVFTHNYGCSQLGDDHLNTQKALSAIAKHPNAGGVLVMGLGCENNQIDHLKEVMGGWDESRLRFIVCQQVRDEVEESFQMIKELVEHTKEDRREPLPLSLLKVGLKCGGSDGFSGITANPLVGRFSDWIVAQGGTSILTEVPEMFGAETILMNRAENKAVFDKTVSLINDFKDYFRKFDQPIYENPSPGNKEGGITTLEDKSLGCTQKGGHSPVVDVLDYGEAVEKKGLNLLNSPGNDLVASSALGISGCQIVLFTTGRGTPFGSFVPTLKISTNTPLYKLKPNWIDFNAGELLEGETMEEALERLVDFTLKVCDGTHLNHEKSGFKEIAIFKSGVTL